MGALNTLRTKGAVVMTGAIAFALLAFLLSDGNFLNSNQDPIVGEIDGEEINFRYFDQEVEDMVFYEKTLSGGANLPEQRMEQISSTVWQKIILERLFAESNDALGLDISDNEMVDMAYGTYTSPILVALFPNQFNQFDRAQFSNFLTMIDTDPSGNLSTFWAMTEQNIKEERVSSKYLDLVSKGIFIADFEADAAANNNSYKYDIKYVSNVVAIRDSSKISEREMKKYYENNKSKYKTERIREVEYVVFEAIPSVVDIEDAQMNFAKLLVEFEASDDVETFVTVNSESSFNPRFYSKENINPMFKSIAFPGKGKKVDTIYKSDLTGNIYTAARISDVEMMPDSITFRAIPVAGTENLDSLVSVIKEGGFEMVVETKSLADASNTRENTLSTSDTHEVKFHTAKKGQVIVLDSPVAPGTKLLVNIIRTTEPVEKVQIAELVYNVKISDRTQRNNSEEAKLFAETAREGGFAKAVAADAMPMRVATLTTYDTEVNGLEGTGEILRWAFGNEVGDVSGVITSGYSNYVVFLKDLTDDKYKSFEKVKTTIENAIRGQRGIDNCIAQLSEFTSLDEAAKELKTEVQSANDITFAAFSIPSLGLAHEMMGLISVTPLKMLSKAVTTGTGAAIFVVESTKENKASTPELEKNLIKTANEANIQNRIYSSISDQMKITDNRVLYM